MINPNDHIQLCSVVSHRYDIHYSEMEQTLQQFLRDVTTAEATINGSFFYALHNMPMDGMMQIEVFVPIEEQSFQIDGFRFHSYYSVESMISINVVNNFEQYTEKAYVLLFEYLQQHQLLQNTPIYHVVHNDVSFPYMTIKIGTMKQSNESVWK